MSIEETQAVEKVRAAVRTTKAAAETAVNTAVNTAQEQLSRATDTGMKTADDLASFGKSNVEAFVQAGSILFHGMEELSRSMFGITQAHVETSLSVAKSLLAAKTLTEFTDLQNAYSKTAFDNAVSDATKISEIALKITNEAIEPIAQRVTATIEQISKPVFSATA